MEHELKILPKYFIEVVSSTKRFEIRKNDRNFKVGDILILKEWEGRYLGPECIVYVDFLLKDTDFEGLASDLCVMSITVRHLNDSRLTKKT